jgi:hypothetical protein
MGVVDVSVVVGVTKVSEVALDAGPVTRSMEKFGEKL